MAHINPTPIDPSQGGPTRIRQPQPGERRAALAVLLTGRPTPHDLAVDHFLEFTDQQGMSLDGLWASYQEQVPVSATLIIPTAGRAAVVFVSPIITHRSVQDTADLLKTAIRDQDPGLLGLIQSLLDPTQRHERDALLNAGFTRLASLVYMRCSCPPRAVASPVDGSEGNSGCTPGDSSAHGGVIELEGTPLTALTWQDDRFDMFAEAISASYLDTLDCPGLVGLRRIEDIIAGHKAVGRFDPDLWSAFYLGDQPVGVLLLNPMTDRPELELVYLGIAPPFRCQGLATRLMRYAASLAAGRDYTGIHLAVDEQNTPAMKLYRGLSYRATGRKVAMIYTLPQSAL